MSVHVTIAFHSNFGRQYIMKLRVYSRVVSQCLAYDELIDRQIIAHIHMALALAELYHNRGISYF